ALRVSGNSKLVTDNYIHGNGSIQGNWISSGTITAAPGEMLRIGAGSGTNTGLLLAQSGGTLYLAGTPKIDPTAGRFVVMVGGTVLTSNLTTTAKLTAGSIELDGVMNIPGGTITSTGIVGSGALYQSGGIINANNLRIGLASLSGGTTTITAGGG